MGKEDMPLSAEALREFAEIARTECGLELGEKEARDAARGVLRLARECLRFREDRDRREAALAGSPEGYRIEGPCAERCNLCSGAKPDEPLWQTRHGVLCAACREAVASGEVPAAGIPREARLDEEELVRLLLLRPQRIASLVSEGKLRARRVPRTGFTTFLLRENRGFLPPRRLLRPGSRPHRDGSATMLEWWEARDPEKALGKYGVFPYIRRLTKARRKLEGKSKS